MNDKYLAVRKEKVIDVAFAAEVIADPGANPPVVGSPEVAEVSHLEVFQVFLETDISGIAISLEQDADGLGPMIDYYAISFNGAQLQTTLKPVTLTPGARSAAPAREIVEIETSDGVIGSVEMEV